MAQDEQRDAEGILDFQRSELAQLEGNEDDASELQEESTVASMEDVALEIGGSMGQKPRLAPRAVRRASMDPARLHSEYEAVCQQQDKLEAAQLKAKSRSQTFQQQLQSLECRMPQLPLPDGHSDEEWERRVAEMLTEQSASNLAIADKLSEVQGRVSKEESTIRAAEEQARLKDQLLRRERQLMLMKRDRASRKELMQKEAKVLQQAFHELALRYQQLGSHYRGLIQTRSGDT
eukprot:gnl/TRDRNA2_/TRDRNA2_159916_c3_seq1.p1 gnl/TRDRNA2_/TRDRNA2_159916_c3~~gnl/TRDRNA2_/TRDRNA2_159916_c3_seq1.p1  ORF type:complete len:234 (-),score=67.70 gnl/TRDRNA2_/TRDRNA2_159916_c3_seq1:58-759(-)